MGMTIRASTGGTSTYFRVFGSAVQYGKIVGL